MRELIWRGTRPQSCDVCDAAIEERFYDAATRLGPWALMCPQCFPIYGRGLGKGAGQEFTKDSAGAFAKSAG